jgi:hypothetical protein
MYSRHRAIEKPIGNNSFSPRPGRILHIPELISGSFADVTVGEKIVFEEIEDDQRKSCTGIKHFIKTTWNGKAVYIFDNHNHALAFWCDAINNGLISPGFTIIHVDQHSDLRPNENIFDVSRIHDERYVENFIDEKTNVGNYIVPATACGLAGRMIRVEGEPALDTLLEEIIPVNSVLNLDMDFFAPCMDAIPFSKKKTAVQKAALAAGVITIATSPYFIDQDLAIRRIHEVFNF